MSVRDSRNPIPATRGIPDGLIPGPIGVLSTWQLKRPHLEGTSFMKLFARVPSRVTVLLLGALVLSACAGGTADVVDEGVDLPGASGDAPATETGGSQDSTLVGSGPSVTYPLTVQNCGSEVTFEEPPERVMTMLTSPVTILHGIGVFDRVFMKAGNYPAEYYDADLAAEVAAVPQLTDEVDASGHLLISGEEIVSHEPDLILGLPDGVSQESLSDAGISVIRDEVYCPGFSEEASFELIYDEVERYGQIFDRVHEADALIADLRDRVDEVSKKIRVEDTRTAVALYPTVGGGALKSYGMSSMVQPQFEALGLKNVFGDQEDRIFEIQPEVLIELDPDVILVLYQGKKDAIKDEVESLPGADQISAVANDRVIYQLFNFTEPATPLTVAGLEQLADELKEGSN